MGEKRIVYMDHSATTYVRKEVLDAMIPYHTELFGNPSSIYSIARASKKAIDTAREQVAKALGAEPDESISHQEGASPTTGPSRVLPGRTGRRATISSRAASSTMQSSMPASTLEKEGFTVTYLPVDQFGLVDPAELEKAITDQTILITVMYANNEIGTIEPIAELGAIARNHKILFHTDAVQVIGNIPVDVKAQNIDLLSLSAHKFYGPKGVGALYIRKSTKIDNLIHGGGQERRRRAGTENIAGIVGLGKAIELATADIEGHNRKIRALRDRLMERILEKIPRCPSQRAPGERLVGNINISFRVHRG